MTDLSEKIFDNWYKIAMFPAYITEKNKRKIVRLIGLIFSIVWFGLFLPLTFIVTVIVIPIAIWEDV